MRLAKDIFLPLSSLLSKTQMRSVGRKIDQFFFLRESGSLSASRCSSFVLLPCFPLCIRTSGCTFPTCSCTLPTCTARTRTRTRGLPSMWSLLAMSLSTECIRRRTQQCMHWLHCAIESASSSQESSMPTSSPSQSCLCAVCSTRARASHPRG